MDVAKADHQQLDAHQRKHGVLPAGQPIKDHPGRHHHHHKPNETPSHVPPRQFDRFGVIPLLVLVEEQRRHYKQSADRPSVTAR